MDNLTKEQRRKNMQHIRSSKTGPEETLAKMLRREKVYFSRNVSSILGKPDFVFRKKKMVVFVDSDFWHGHSKRFIMPKTNVSYWRNKIETNKKRDKKVSCALRKSGWKVVRLWEHDVMRETNACVRKVLRAARVAAEGSGA